MDWYLAGRILGVIGWPLAAAALVYAVGWMLASLRPPQPGSPQHVWINICAAMAFLVTLFATGVHLLRYLRLIG